MLANAEGSDSESQSNSAPAQRQGPVQVSAKEWKAKFNAKGEQYHMMTYECNAYLPPKEVVSTYWISDMVEGKKNCK